MPLTERNTSGPTETTVTGKKISASGHDRGRNKWFEAALKALVEEGVDAVRVERLAAHLGLTRGSFYHHYKDHAELLHALLAHYIETNQQRFLTMLPLLQGTPKERLWVLWTATADQAFRDYDWAVRMWGMHDPHVAAVLEQIDNKRMDVMINLFKEMGFSADESWIRAALAYHGSLGDRAFFAPFPSMEKRLLWRRIALEILSRTD